MLDIKKIDHVGIRVRDRARAVAFYESLGFVVKSEGVFDKGHPVIMEHPSGVVINVLGPATGVDGPNVLMDTDDKPPSYTHMALHVGSLDEVRAFMTKNAIPITGEIAFGDLHAIFVRDPDRNVIEFDEYPGEAPSTRGSNGPSGGYDEHP